MVSTATDRRLGLNSGSAIKVPCQAVATSAIVLSGEQTIGGVAVHAVGANGNPDRVLVTGGSTVNPGSSSIDNGVWQVQTGTWTRDIDFNGIWDVLSGTLVPVLGIPVTIYQLITPDPISAFGSTPIAFQASVYSASAQSYQPLGAGAVATTQAGKNQETISVWDFLTAAQKADVLAGTLLVDCTAAIQAAITYAASSYQRALKQPAGSYLVGCSLTIPAGFTNGRWYGEGSSTIMKASAGFASANMVTGAATLSLLTMDELTFDASNIAGITTVNLARTQLNPEQRARFSHQHPPDQASAPT